MPLHPGAQGLRDDTGRLGRTIITTDTIVEGVHFRSNDLPADVAWKLLAVNLSDLAAKGAVPIAVLLNYTLTGDSHWDRAFLGGLGQALRQFEVQMLGGDTVALPAPAPRVLTLTAIGEADIAPLRSGAREGDALYVTGMIGDGGAGLAVARAGVGSAALLAAYLRPIPRLREGQALAPLVNAMMDVSDGLLIDASRMALASGLAVRIALDAIPLSPAYRAACGADRAARLQAATAGDDYQLLFAAPPDLALPVPATCIGSFSRGDGLSLTDGVDVIPLPARLGFEHAG